MMRRGSHWMGLMLGREPVRIGRTLTAKALSPPAKLCAVWSVFGTTNRSHQLFSSIGHFCSSYRWLWQASIGTPSWWKQFAAFFEFWLACTSTMPIWQTWSLQALLPNGLLGCWTISWAHPSQKTKDNHLQSQALRYIFGVRLWLQYHQNRITVHVWPSGLVRGYYSPRPKYFQSIIATAKELNSSTSWRMASSDKLVVVAFVQSKITNMAARTPFPGRCWPDYHDLGSAAHKTVLAHELRLVACCLLPPAQHKTQCAQGQEATWFCVPFHLDRVKRLRQTSRTRCLTGWNQVPRR